MYTSWMLTTSKHLERCCAYNTPLKCIIPKSLSPKFINYAHIHEPQALFCNLLPQRMHTSWMQINLKHLKRSCSYNSLLRCFISKSLSPKFINYGHINEPQALLWTLLPPIMYTSCLKAITSHLSTSFCVT